MTIFKLSFNMLQWEVKEEKVINISFCLAAHAILPVPLIG